jgi:hypothetical protein
MKVMRVNKGRWLSIPVSVIGSVALTLLYLAILELFTTHMTIALWMLLSPVVLMLWTGRKILEIDVSNSQYHQYLWLVGRKWKVVSKPFSCVGFQIMPSYKETPYGIRRFYIFKALGQPQEVEILRTTDLQYLLKKRTTIQQKTGLSVEFFDEN